MSHSPRATPVPMRQHNFRIEDAFRRRIESYRKQVRERSGMVPTFSDAVRGLIERGLRSAGL